jgi:2-polyprenyl-3-methyl-5-hydroxy-6-metoxy-1,4-benzoquinol methylase
MGKNILEVGPGAGPASEFIARFPNPKVTFVGEQDQRIKFDHAKMFPGSEYYAIGFLAFVNDLAQASSFDYVIARNVLNSPGTDLNTMKLAAGSAYLLKPRGILIVEHTTNMVKPWMADLINADIEKFGFRTEIHWSRNQFASPSAYDMYQDGFSLHAVKP